MSELMHVCGHREELNAWHLCSMCGTEWKGLKATLKEVTKERDDQVLISKVLNQNLLKVEKDWEDLRAKLIKAHKMIVAKDEAMNKFSDDTIWPTLQKALDLTPDSLKNKVLVDKK